MRLKLARVLLCSVALSVASGACSKTNNVDQSKETTNFITGTVDEDGGPVGDRNQLGAFVPAGAVDAAEEITIRTAEEGEYPTLRSTAVGEVFSFEPHGLEFNTEVSVYLPLPEGGNAMDYDVYHASVGGDWERLERGTNQSKTSIRALTLSFSYFVLDKAEYMPPDTNPGGAGRAGAGSTGAGGTASTGGDGSGGRAPIGGDENMGGKPGAGGTPANGGNGGTPGAGGSGGGAACTVDEMAETGTCEGSGQVMGQSGSVLFTAADGFAVTSDTSPPELSLVFTDYPFACGAALGMGGSKQDQRHKPTGLPNSSLLSANLRMDDVNGETMVVEGAYPRAQRGDNIEVVYVETDDKCMPASLLPQPGAGKTITITTIDADHVEGTVTFNPGSGVVTVDFNLPMCPLSSTPMPTCCVQ